MAKATRALDEGKRRRAEQDAAALEVHRAKCRAGEAASCAAAAAAGAAVVVCASCVFFGFRVLCFRA